MRQPDSSNDSPVALARLPQPRRPRGKLFLVPAGARRRAGDPGRTGRLKWMEAGRETDKLDDARDPYDVAFRFLYLFTLLLYIRPDDLFPALGSHPVAKIAATVAFISYACARYRLGKPIINWTIEVQMVCMMLCLAILFTPVAASPGDSVTALSESFLKVVTVFILMIGVINTRARLRKILSLTVILGTWLAVFAIKDYATGNLTMMGDRIEGRVGGIFGNPNDLAAALNMLIPLAVTLAMMSAGAARLFYIACALALTGGVIVTFSRGGFLTLIALAGVMMWKFGRGRREKSHSGGHHRVRRSRHSRARQVSRPPRLDLRSQPGHRRFGSKQKRVVETGRGSGHSESDCRNRNGKLSHLFNRRKGRA